MNKYLISLLLIFAMQIGVAQNTEEGLTKDLETYIKITKAQDYDSLLHFVNPKLFNIVSREMLSSTFEQVFNVPGMNFSFGEFEVLKSYGVEKLNGTDYSLIDYKMDMNMEITDEEMLEALPMMVAGMEMQFGKDQVKLDEETNTFLINAKKTMFAEYVGDRWTFVDYDSGKQGIMESLIPQEVQDALLKKKYKE